MEVYFKLYFTARVFPRTARARRAHCNANHTAGFLSRCMIPHLFTYIFLLNRTISGDSSNESKRAYVKARRPYMKTRKSPACASPSPSRHTYVRTVGCDINQQLGRDGGGSLLRCSGTAIRIVACDVPLYIRTSPCQSYLPIRVCVVSTQPLFWPPCWPEIRTGNCQPRRPCGTSSLPQKLWSGGHLGDPLLHRYAISYAKRSMILAYGDPLSHV